MVIRTIRLVAEIWISLADEARRAGVWPGPCARHAAREIVPIWHNPGQAAGQHVGLPPQTAEWELDTTTAAGRAVQVPNPRVESSPDSQRWWVRSWRPAFLRFVCNVLLPLGIVITTAIAAVNHGSMRVYWSLGSFVCIAITGLVNYYKDRTASAIRNAAIRINTDLRRS